MNTSHHLAARAAHRRGWRWRATVLVLIMAPVLLVRGDVGVIAASVDTEGSEAAADAVRDDAAVRFLVEEYGIDPIEAVRRLDQQELVPYLVATGLRDFGDTFAGAWIDHGDGGVVRVAFTDSGDASVAALRTRFPDLAPALRLVSDVARTLPDLQRTYDDVNEELGRAVDAYVRDHGDAEGFPIVAVGLDVIRNGVVVGVTDATRREVAELAERFGDDIVIEPDASEVSFDSHDCHSPEVCGPPLRGGTLIYPIELVDETIVGPGCTLAFIAVDIPPFGLSVNEAPRNFYATTAGHCFSEGTSTATDAVHQTPLRVPVGPVVRSSVEGRLQGAFRSVDVASILIPRTEGIAEATGSDPVDVRPWPGTNFWKPSRWVYHDAAAQRLQMHGYLANGLLAAPGVVVCRAGANGIADPQCGDITDTLATFLTQTAPFVTFNMLEYRMCSEGGDSGGPVYTRNANNGVPQGTAFGIHAGGNQDSCTNSSRRGYATHWYMAAAFLDVWLWCGENTSCTPVGVL